MTSQKHKENKKGYVTVLIPVYNREVMVVECLKSVCSQVYEQLEIKVVDDASTDNTVEVVKSFMESDPRISLVVHESNSGSQSKAMADTIEQCNTEFFTWLGSDDKYCVANAISQFVSQHEQHLNVDYVSCDLRMTNHSESSCTYCKNVWPNWSGFASSSVNAPLKAFDKISYVRCIYDPLCPPFPWNGMWKTSFFQKHNLTWRTYQGNTWSPDTLNSLYFFSKGMKAMHYNESGPLIQYNLHSGQDTQTGIVREQIRCDVTLINAIFEWYTPEEFLGKHLSEGELHLEYLERLKRLILSHEAQHSDTTTHLAKALEDVALTALCYAWDKLRNQIPSEMHTFFKKYVQR